MTQYKSIIASEPYTLIFLSYIDHTLKDHFGLHSMLMTVRLEIKCPAYVTYASLTGKGSIKGKFNMISAKCMIKTIHHIGIIMIEY